MILARETFKKFGYWPKDLKQKSSKKVIYKCAYCFLHFETEMANYTKKKSTNCNSCSTIKRNKVRFNNYSGKSIGTYFVTAEFKKLRNRFLWKIICKCGIQKFIQVSKRQSTCGNQCKFKENGFDGYEGITKTYWSSLQTNAKLRKKKLTFEISMKYAWELFLLQDYRCALTGIKLELSRKYKTASLDRIDSSKGYVEGNVQWVLNKVNVMKWDNSDSDFIALCEAVTEYNRSKK